MMRLILICLASLASACASVYTLPPPAAQPETVSLIPGEDERAKERLYLEARAAILRLNQLLASKRYREALGQMSQETRDFLTFTSPDPKAQVPAEITLAQGKLMLKGGQEIVIEPGAFLLAADLSNLKDSVEGQAEQETPRRKEIFAVQPDGKARRIVMIREGAQWVLHRVSAEVR